jgi:GGDEF domain-containing protein
MYHPNPTTGLMINAYERGVEDFIYGEWSDRLVKVRIRKVIERSRRDLSINPSTRLPGPAIIEREMDRMLEMSAEFAVGYADLDNFKAYNDYYGYFHGDKVIQLTARVVKDVVCDLCDGGFVGHIAGDDFMFMVPIEEIDRVCRAIIETFDTLIPYRYEEEDRERGFITTTSRRGEIENFPLLTISVAVLLNRAGEFQHVGEISKMLADLKKATKSKSGSNYMIERRRKY